MCLDKVLFLHDMTPYILVDMYVDVGGKFCVCLEGAVKMETGEM